MKVDFYDFDTVEESRFAYAVIATRYKGGWLFVKHRERDTWEIPGGRRERGESIAETARRELFEETGALDYTLTPLCVYSVLREPGELSFGALFLAEVTGLGPLPESEIATVACFREIPERLTYPEIQPFLWGRVRGLYPSEG